MFSLPKPQGKSGEDNSTSVYKALHFACLPKRQTLVDLESKRRCLSARVFYFYLQRCCKKSQHTLRAKQTKMAVSPYVSRVELWLANASFRPSFRLPDEFHPSIFLKWFPGSMAKGELFIILCFLQNLDIHVSHVFNFLSLLGS